MKRSSRLHDWLERRAERRKRRRELEQLFAQLRPDELRLLRLSRDRIAALSPEQQRELGQRIGAVLRERKSQ